MSNKNTTVTETETALKMTPAEKKILTFLLEDRLDNNMFERQDYQDEIKLMKELYKKITGTEF